MKSESKKKPRVQWAKYRDRVRWISQNLGREVTPNDVLKDARSPASPLHAWFTWDVRKGWNKNLLQEARQLLSRLKVIYHDASGNEVPVREYVRLVMEEPATHRLRAGYVPRPKAIGTAELHRQSAELACTELNAFKVRWRGFSRIEAGFAYVDMAIAAIRKSADKTFKKAAI